jgi:parallel beta-helix repeat protein
MLTIMALAAAAVLVVGAGVGAAEKTWYVDDGGGADYDNIQDAVNVASDGDTIFVHSGVYTETVIVNRSLTLQGEDRNTTIIDGDGESCVPIYFRDDCICVDSDHVNISEFTLQKGSTGISIDSNYNEIFNNKVISCGTGIELWNSDYSNITNNTVLLCNPNIFIGYSDYNIISNNIIYSPHCYGIQLENSSNNVILNNIIYSTHKSSVYGIELLSSMYNEIYHNDLINNTNHAYDDGDTNSWDKGPVIGGNYWSGHECTGNPSDGSQPYYVGVDSIDHYPFGHPVNDVSSVPPPEPIVSVGAQMRERLSTYETHIDHTKDYEFEVDPWRIGISSIHNLKTDNITYTITTPMNFTYLYNSEEYTNGTYGDITLNFTQTGDNYTWVLPMKDRINSKIRLKPLDETFRQKKPCADMDVDMIDENGHTRLNITIVPTIGCSCDLEIYGTNIINITSHPPNFCIEDLDYDYVEFDSDMEKNQTYHLSILLDNPESVKSRYATHGYTTEGYEWGFCYSNNFARPVTTLGSIDVTSAVPVGWEYTEPYPGYRQYIEIKLAPIPDLTLSQSDITFSNPNPVQDEEVTIGAAIQNIGTADASDVIVQFLDNGVQTGSDQMISAINADETESVQINWTATYGSHNISVIIDPYDEIVESDEDNNIAYKLLLLKGDLNGDGDITTADAAIALQLAATGAHDDAADVSGDGCVTSLDALMILQAAAGSVTL